MVLDLLCLLERAFWMLLEPKKAYPIMSHAAQAVQGAEYFACTLWLSRRRSSMVPYSLPSHQRQLDYDRLRLGMTWMPMQGSSPPACRGAIVDLKRVVVVLWELASDNISPQKTVPT